MRLKVAVVSAMALAAVAAAPAAAQQAASANALQEGRRSISFGLPSGGGSSFGIWTMLSERTNLGLIGQLQVEQQDDPDVDSWGLRLAPAIKRYVRRAGPVAPFLYGNVALGWESETQPGGEESAWSIGTFGGLGVEWFPVSSVSIGGHTGIGLEYRSIDVDPTIGASQSSSELALRTATSQLSIQIYFGGPRGGGVASGQ